jgi:hypothetical protein
VSSITALVGHLWYSVDVFFVQSSLGALKESVGLLWAISGAEGLVGSLLVLLMGNRRKSEATLLTGLFLRGASLIWYATMTRYAWAVPAAFLAGLGDTCIIVALGSLVIERTKPGMLGRGHSLSGHGKRANHGIRAGHGESAEHLAEARASFAALWSGTLPCRHQCRFWAEGFSQVTSILISTVSVYTFCHLSRIVRMTDVLFLVMRYSWGKRVGAFAPNREHNALAIS